MHQPANSVQGKEDHRMNIEIFGLLYNSDVRLIYLDYNAATPIDPFVLDTMMSYLREHFGNRSRQLHYAPAT
jgi:selenocysteine lyase/cysteine desulfurase